MIRYLRAVFWGSPLCEACQKYPQVSDSLCRWCTARLQQFRTVRQSAKISSSPKFPEDRGSTAHL